MFKEFEGEFYDYYSLAEHSGLFLKLHAESFTLFYVEILVRSSK